MHRHSAWYSSVPPRRTHWQCSYHKMSFARISLSTSEPSSNLKYTGSRIRKSFAIRVIMHNSDDQFPVQPSIARTSFDSAITAMALSLTDTLLAERICSESALQDHGGHLAIVPILPALLICMFFEGPSGLFGEFLLTTSFA